MYDPRVMIAPGSEIDVEAEAVADERQLDGRRHLELTGEDAAASLEAALRLVITRAGDVEEAELELADAAGESETVALDEEGDVEQMDPLSAALAGGGFEVFVEQDEEGGYRMRISRAEGGA